MSDLQVEILDHNWIRKGISSSVSSVRITEELGQVGSADVTFPLDDPIIQVVPDPDATTGRYEGRFKIYADGVEEFVGVIDSESKKISESSGELSFNGKHRGIILGFHNTGRVDYLGWALQDLFRELTRNNIARELTFVSASSQDELYGAYQMVTGDPFKQNYWKTTTSTPTHTATFKFNDTRTIHAIRVMPQWWLDLDTKKFHYHQFNIQTSLDGTSWTTRGTKSSTLGSDARGHLYEFTADVKFVRINVTGSTDGMARIAQLMVYQNISEIGGDTTYTVPFVENDDSGNVSTSGAATRPIVPGAFQGDGVITHSYVTQLGAGGSAVHTFRGTQNAVYFTQHDAGAATVDIAVDGVFRKQVSIPNNSYFFKGYDTLEDFGDLLNEGIHTLTITRVSGSPQIDYFNGQYLTSWRPIEDDDPSLAYVGAWTSSEAAYYHQFFAAVSETTGDTLHFNFYGDFVRIVGERGSGLGSFKWLIDGVEQGTVNTGTGSGHKQNLASWSGTYGSHSVTLVNNGGKIIIDRIEGNFAHTLYMRARYESNLKVLQRMSEIIDSWLKFNNDGSVDLIGNVGAYGGTIVREGENEGGAIIQANATNDYQETGSACLALVNVNGEMPIKALVIDREAVKEMGFKLIKLENADAADQFLLNRQALQYLRDHRKPERSYTVEFDPDEVIGEVNAGDSTILYSPSLNLQGTKYRIGRKVTEYLKD